MKYADTIHTIEKRNAGHGAGLVADWEKELAKVDAPGAKSILHNLVSLRKQLEKDEPDADRLAKLLADLGEGTTRIADHADKGGDKLKELGAALSKAGK